MGSHKAEDLPKDTVIETEENLFFMKSELKQWVEMFAHCGDCAKVVVEGEGVYECMVSPHFKDASLTLEVLFGDFKVVAAPESMVWK